MSRAWGRHLQLAMTLNVRTLFRELDNTASVCILFRTSLDCAPKIVFSSTSCSLDHSPSASIMKFSCTILQLGYCLVSPHRNMVRTSQCPSSRDCPAKGSSFPQLAPSSLCDLRPGALLAWTKVCSA